MKNKINKNKRITIRMTSEEWEQLQRLCHVVGTTKVAEVVRRLIQNQSNLFAKKV